MRFTLRRLAASPPEISRNNASLNLWLPMNDGLFHVFPLYWIGDHARNPERTDGSTRSSSRCSCWACSGGAGQAADQRLSADAVEDDAGSEKNAEKTAGAGAVMEFLVVIHDIRAPGWVGRTAGAATWTG
jgi:hypothetical protein